MAAGATVVRRWRGSGRPPVDVEGDGAAELQGRRPLRWRRRDAIRRWRGRRRLPPSWKGAPSDKHAVEQSRWRGCLGHRRGRQRGCCVGRCVQEEVITAMRSGRGDRAPGHGCQHLFPFFCWDRAPDCAFFCGDPWSCLVGASFYFSSAYAGGMSSCPSKKNDKCTRKFWLGGITSIWGVRFNYWD
jgi:hypothetical protein